jgi:hypothetical protein
MNYQKARCRGANSTVKGEATSMVGKFIRIMKELHKEKEMYKKSAIQNQAYIFTMQNRINDCGNFSKEVRADNDRLRSENERLLMRLIEAEKSKE